MKDVNIIEALQDKYSDKEILHYVSKQLDYVSRALSKDATPENLLRQIGSILQINEYLKAVDARMNHIEKTSALVA